jgi:hypothetical protein
MSLSIDEHLLADTELATELKTQEDQIALQVKQMMERIEVLVAEAERCAKAREALNLPATYNYRKSSKSFAKLVRERGYGAGRPTRRRKKTTRPKAGRSR